jgi:hypothetical protein
MNSIFLKGIQTPAPWHTKRCQSTRQPVDRICDLNGTHIADMIMPDTRNYTPEQYRNNRNLVVNAPRILAALLEATYTLHEMGIEPSEELKKLIRDSGGPAV